MIFNGHGPLVQRCDGFNVSFTSIQSKCNHISSVIMTKSCWGKGEVRYSQCAPNIDFQRSNLNHKPYIGSSSLPSDWKQLQLSSIFSRKMFSAFEEEKNLIIFIYWRFKPFSSLHRKRMKTEKRQNSFSCNNHIESLSLPSLFLAIVNLMKIHHCIICIWNWLDISINYQPHSQCRTYSSE